MQEDPRNPVVQDFSDFQFLFSNSQVHTQSRIIPSFHLRNFHSPFNKFTRGQYPPSPLSLFFSQWNLEKLDVCSTKEQGTVLIMNSADPSHKRQQLQLLLKRIDHVGLCPSAARHNPTSQRCLDIEQVYAERFRRSMQLHSRTQTFWHPSDTDSWHRLFEK